MSHAKRHKRNSRESPPFVRLEKDMIFNCEEWRNLSGAAKHLYLCIKAKYNGSNNGEIRLAYSELKGISGISSSGTFSKAQKELLQKGWIKITRRGGLYRYSNLYELTWEYDCLD